MDKNISTRYFARMDKVTAPTKLKRWLKEEGRMSYWLATKIGVTNVTLSYWVTGRRTPSLDHAFKIEEITEGAIKASDWRSS